MGAHRPAAAAGHSGESEEWLSPADELFARLVHDLRNPLGIIAAFAEALPEAAAEERDDLCERVRVNAQRALQVLEELSLLADLRAGRAEPGGFDDCDLGELLDDAAAAVARRAQPIRRAAPLPPRARVPRAHLACALRDVLRQVVHAAAPGDDIELSAAATSVGVVLRIAVAALLADLDLELADAVGSLYDGRCTIERGPAATVITLTVR